MERDRKEVADITEVSVGQREKNTRVEKQTNEYTVGDRCHELRVCVIADGCNQHDDDLLQDEIDGNDRNHDTV